MSRTGNYAPCLYEEKNVPGYYEENKNMSVESVRAQQQKKCSMFV